MRGTVSAIGFAMLTAGLLSALGFLIASSVTGPRSEARAHAPDPFLGLEEAIAASGTHPDWEIHRAPELPGPYRVVGPALPIGADPARWNTLVFRGVTVELQGREEFCQMAIYLETPDGEITGAVLKRPPLDEAE